MKIDDRFYMQLALGEAWRYQGLTYPNPAVGCCVVKEGRILAVEAHHKAGESHAELWAMLAAYEALEGREAAVDSADADAVYDFLQTVPEELFRGVSLYVTLEPCAHHGRTPSCAWALSRFPLHRVVVATADPIPGHGGGLEILADHGIEVATGVCEEEARELLEPFLIWQERAFVLFKLAQTTNGRIGGGYLSSPESLEHVHRLRAVVDELLIGGSTVRTDRPTLDCRFVDQKRAPNVCIYSRQNEFDRSIPLFGVSDRQVRITDDIEPLLDRPSFLLVEGGEGMLKALQDRIDWLLLYQTPKLSAHPLSYNVDQKLKYLHHASIGVDLILWSRFE
ncbi:bifunctional diaminohydroxyphosphoribosylaminopyrimidine deaminase/5-amino-6-(5-phosphoribosylamino)uracil reductase RibD [Nitratifractor salsuginis]|uniref:Riboflavin biosynthesis protein RibD n=1 Tax=Nitratifractor salsuginis (strain DSM 16511 / JCM 12458 / E9I37-1) TaxID=749222 RepID=E6X179_NITSE|nr:bifunctional diaminohydroxyphosphoribosylaminopyrimidine deaminase/5-amino-6-(5-phosphoribosylamino)uracil reductase RibD [Nitratifractor salsuginis]ADV46941.1 riboflavin biosynthesis protein RibD [Nitratifractor salsuginis DSM 16511]